jgi:DNA-binding protein YbaB
VFDSLKAMGALAGLLKNKEALKQAGERIQRRLREVRAAGSSGGGAVRVTVDGTMRVLEVRLEPALAANLVSDESSKSMAESLIADAVNDAIHQSQVLAHREVSKEAEAMGLPDLPGLDKLFGGGGA